ncbi:MAG: FAD-dependent oxidoreductase, partial [Chloroflexota bacterium]|nr:FAD-dependent oxidoreductase [Chloroflexota bacterium]
MDFILEQKRTPVIRKVDVVVVGGGPAGFGAAVAAARNGAETLIVERYGFLGGMPTTGLVRYLPIDKLTPMPAYGETRPLQGGIIQELVQELVELGGSPEPAKSYPSSIGFETFFPTDPEILKVVLPDMLKGAGSSILLHALAVDAVKEGNNVKGIIIESKSGRQAILARVVIDASGDADIAAAAGAQYDKFSKPLMMSLNGALANVDVGRALEYATREGKAKFDALVKQAIKNGDLAVTEKKVLPETQPILVKPQIVLAPDKLPEKWHRRGETLGWMESVLGDCTDVNDLTRAELETRKTVLS